jgi:pimeloyl-ACP methyl ester carboxylesterase
MDSTIILNDIIINYQVSGKGKPMILLHGWGCDYHIFDKIITFLEKSFQVYAIDLPGYGKSATPTVVWGTQQYADIVRTFIETLGIEKPIILGHSFGGRTALALAAEFDIPKLILVGSAGITPKRSWKYYYKVYSFKFLKKIAEILPTQYEQKLKGYFLNKTASADYKNASPILRGILSKVVNEDLKYLMPKIKSSTLLIFGEKDTATPVEDGKTMEKLIPDAGLVVMKNCGHYCFLEKMPEFLIIIDKFLEKDKLL